MERHPALAVPLAASHFGATETTGGLHPHPLGPGLEGGLHRPLQGTAERHPALELIGDGTRQQLGVGLGVLHLDDIDLDLPLGELLQGGAQAIHLGAGAADHHAGAGGVDVDLHLLLSDALDLDARQGTADQFLLQEVADLGVLEHLGGIFLLAVPTRLPVGDDPEPEAVGVDLLAHQALSSSRPSPTTMVT